MDPLFVSLQANALLFMLMMVRVGALFITAPVLSSKAIPAKVRSALAVALVLTMMPLIAGRPDAVMPTTTVEYILLAGKELIVGAAIGLIAQMIFAAVQLAGSFIDLSAGFAIASTIDPVNNINLTVLGRVYNMIATAAFVAVGGHLLVIQGLLASFVLVPVGEMPRFTALSQGVLAASDDLFVIALQLAAPLMAALVITDVALGVMSRAAPQMNVFAVGMPLKIGLALLGSAFLMPAFVGHFNQVTEGMITLASDVLDGARP